MCSVGLLLLMRAPVLVAWVGGCPLGDVAEHPVSSEEAPKGLGVPEMLSLGDKSSTGGNDAYAARQPPEVLPEGTLMRRVWLALIVLVLFGDSVAVAQETEPGDATTLRATEITGCPEDRVCVDYKGAELVVDPRCGPVVSFAVADRLIRTRDLDGSTEVYDVQGVTLGVTDDGGYEVVHEWGEPATGPLEDVRFGAVGCLSWSSTEDP